MIENFSIEEMSILEDIEIVEYLQEDVDYIISEIELIKQKKKIVYETGLLLYYNKEDEEEVLSSLNAMYIYERWVSIMDIIESDLIPKVLTIKLFEEFSEYYIANEDWLN